MKNNKAKILSVIDFRLCFLPILLPNTKIYLEASGDIEIHINNTIMHFTDLESPIVIDGELMNVTDEIGTNMNSHMVGDFPVLTPGENTISILCEEPSEFIQMNIEYRSLWL